MIAKTLKQILQGLPDDTLVYIQTGNNDWDEVNSLDVHHDPDAEFTILALNKE